MSAVTRLPAPSGRCVNRAVRKELAAELDKILRPAAFTQQCGSPLPEPSPDSDLSSEEDITDRDADETDDEPAHLEGVDFATEFSDLLLSSPLSSECDISDHEENEEPLGTVAHPQLTLKGTPRPEETLRSDLRSWAINFNVPFTTLRPLLRILNPVLPMLPKAEQTLMKTAPIEGVRPMGKGEFYNFGIRNRLLQVLKYYESPVLEIVFNTDGLPLFKSSGTECWPIMGLVKGSKTPPFVCAVYCGNGKPPADEFLADFVAELKPLVTHGFTHEGRFHQVKISCFVCDSPAKALVKGVQLHTAYHSCCYCTTRGKWKNRIVLPQTNAPLRTDESFRAMADAVHHAYESPLLPLDIDMVNAFPCDYQHLLCLGVGRKLLTRVVHGQRKVGAKLVTDEGVERINRRLLAVLRWWARDFCRRPRILEELLRWKAAEFRQFLLYLVPVVLRGSVLPAKTLELFFLLHIAMTIIVRKDLLSRYSDVADWCLNDFVTKARVHLKTEFITHNVHNLVHIVPHCKLYGPVDNFSAFPFENELHVLKRAVRGNSKVIQQIVNRINDRHETSQKPRVDIHVEGEVSKPHRKNRWMLHLKGECYSRLFIRGRKVSLLRGDNFVQMDSGAIVMLNNIVKTVDGVFVVGQQFRERTDLYEKPVRSSCFGIYKVDRLSLQLMSWPVQRIACKVLGVAFHKQKSSFGIFPFPAEEET